MSANPLTKIANLIARGILNLTNDAGKTQTVQVSLLADEVRDGIEHVYEYGFTSNPIAGAEAITTFINGNKDNGVVTTIYDKRYRPRDLQPGEVMLHTHETPRVYLKKDNKILVTCSAEIKIQCGNSVITMTPSSVTVDTQNFTVNASSAVVINTPSFDLNN